MASPSDASRQGGTGREAGAPSPAGRAAPSPAAASPAQDLPWRPDGPGADARLNGIGRPRMTPAERAKIFMPFNPLKGFQEALREKEAEAEARDARLWHASPFDDEDLAAR